MRPVLLAAHKTVDVPLSYAPLASDFAVTDVGYVEVTITATKPVVWTWISTGAVPSATLATGGTGQSITFSLAYAGAGAATNSSVTLKSNGNTWHIALSAQNPASG